MARLAADLAGLSPRSSAWDFCRPIWLDRTDLARRYGAAGSVTARMRAVAIWQFLNFAREQSPVRAGAPIQRTLDRVRQLVLLAEERDLRQVPAAALHLDAVRLMTVHGSKGLEFEAVHVPGLTKSSFPASNRGQRCPPPTGMIEGASAVRLGRGQTGARARRGMSLLRGAVAGAHAPYTLACAQTAQWQQSLAVALSRLATG